MPAPTFDNICAIIVTLEVDVDFKQRVENIIHQVAKVVIVDNSSGDKTIKILQDLADNKKIFVIFNKQNLGIAAALNEGIFWALNNGYHWALTLDDDSTAEPFMVETLSGIYNSVMDQEHIAIIGANHIDPTTKELYVDPGRGKVKDWITRVTVITSGSLMPLKAYQKIGPLRNDFFIDGVDHEYCLRARSKGFKIYLALKPILRHPMGNRKKISLIIPWIKIVTTNYQPFRWYFLVRNRLILVKEYLFKEPIWCISRLIRMIGLMGIMLFFEKKRAQKVKFIFLGFADFIHGNMSRDIRPHMIKTR